MRPALLKTLAILSIVGMAGAVGVALCFPTELAEAVRMVIGETFPKGKPIRRRDLPNGGFGVTEAYDMRVVYRANMGEVVRNFKATDGNVFFVEPPSDNGWPQRVNAIKVIANGKELQADTSLDEFGRPLYWTKATPSAGEFSVAVEYTLCKRVITRGMKNPNPITLSSDDREKYTGDYAHVKGITSGANKVELAAAGLRKQANETDWDFVARVMEDAKSRWHYHSEKANWPAKPTDWLNQTNTGNCEDIATYLAWILRENKIPARLSVPTFQASKRNSGAYVGHCVVEWFHAAQGAWVPADLTDVVEYKFPVAKALGRDREDVNVAFLASDDCSYRLKRNPGYFQGVGILYGARLWFAAKDWDSAVGFGGSPNFESVVYRPVVDN